MRRKSTLDPEMAKELLEMQKQPPPFPGVAPPPDRTLFDMNRCEHCGGVHSRECPRVAHKEFHEGGALKSVSYFPHGQWPIEQVIWLEDVIEAANLSDGNE